MIMKKLIFALILGFLAIQFETQAACTIKYKSNLRGDATTHSSIVSALPKYTPLVILEKNGDWFKVKGMKFEGWLFHSLLDENLECMSLKDTANAFCPTKNEQHKRAIEYNEGFKVLRKEIGCNLVLDRNRRQLWLNNTNVFPETASMKIRFN
ncbi:hypothetical protein BIY24_04240 [Halobacteriovorax marinus]|nr:hypothetical protein BIY24_04240 [Halobacteriovorax marinus]